MPAPEAPVRLLSLSDFFEQGRDICYWPGSPLDILKYMDREEVFELAIYFENLALHGNLTDKSRARAGWASRVYLILAYLPEIKTIGEGMASSIESPRILKKYIARSTPMPALFPEDIRTVNAPLEGRLYRNEIPWEIITHDTKLPFVVLPNSTLILSSAQTDRHLTITRGSDVFAAGLFTLDGEGFLKVLPKSFDYFNPPNREPFIWKLVNFLDTQSESEA